MSKAVTLEKIQCGIPLQIQLKKTGIAVKFEDSENPQRNGHLRIGKRVHWSFSTPGNSMEVHKEWEELIDFMMN